MKQSAVLTVGILLYPNCTLMDFAGATQVFAAPFGFKPIWIAQEHSVMTSDGVAVVPNYDFRNTPKIDILFVPGGNADGVSAMMEDQDCLDFIRKTAATATWTGSVCTGAFILAAAGILKNCLATTYWSQIPVLGLLAQKYNLTIPDGFPRFLIDEKNRLFTGGGISSSLDLALQLVLEIKGKEAAEMTQLFIQYQPAPPINSGDPAHAPKEITAALTESGKGFTETMIAAVEKLF